MEVKPLRELYRMMQEDPKNNSITKKHLTQAIVEKYENERTALGGTLALCVNTNAYNPGAILCRSADLEAYEKFRDFFDAVIRDYHKVKTAEIAHPKCNFGDENNLPFGPVDPTGKYVVSTRVRCGRTVKGYAFAPVISKEDRIELERKIAAALGTLSGDLAGEYHSLNGMDPALQKQLIADHYLFRDDDSVLRDAGGYRDWPTGRGIFFNKDKTFVVWINEEDHMRIISMQKGGDLAEVYRRLTTAVKTLEKALDFASHDRFGFITFCPSNLGTTMRASVHVRIPLLAQLPNFKEICEAYNLQARGTHGEHTAAVGGVYDISNKRRLGLTEIEAAKEMATGVAAMIGLERALEENNADMPPGVMPVEPLRMLAEMLWNDASCNTIVKRHLTLDLVKKYERMRTKNGVMLAHCIRNCAYNRRAICPRMGDLESLSMFKEYLEAVIKDYHKVVGDKISHPTPTFGDLNNLPFEDLDPSGQFVVSTRVRVGRSVEGFSFPISISKDKRGELEAKVSGALKNLDGDHAGTYYPLLGMNSDVQKQLIEDHFLFKDDDSVLRDAGGYRDWPQGRGIFHNNDKTFLVWVVEEDHMRIISMEKGGDLKKIYKRLVEGIQKCEKHLSFAKHPDYGYITSCPSNLGTTMRASVHLRIPKLSSDKKKLDEVCASYNLQARGFHGEHTESPEGIYDISNKRRLGLTELDAALEMANGVKEMIKIESSL